MPSHSGKGETMNMMKATTIILFSYTLSINGIKLTNPILKRIDGKIGLVGERIKDMLHMRRELNNRIKGHATRNAQVRMGHYSFHGQSYTLQELATMEKELYAELDIARNTQDASRIHELERSIEAMRNLLEYVKDDLFEIAGPFLGPASDMKALAVTLIAESCEKRGKAESLLLKWQKVPRGQEIEQFKEMITSFSQVLEFCSDLADYLIDMVESAPKGFAQFKRDYR
jgi:hypothetical protein